MKGKKKISYVLIVLLMLLFFMLGGGLTLLAVKTNSLASRKNGSEKSDSDMSYNSCSNCMSGTMIVNNTGISDAVSKIYDSVVMVKNIKNGSDNGSGSGFVYKKDSKYGYIMTNQHVVDDATGVKILLTSGEEIEGTILGGDEYLDVAVIRIPADKVISVAQIGSTEDLKLGEQIFAIGTPVGEEYFNTVTSGYVSGLNRKLTVSVNSTNDWVQEVLQIDASINPGNSGGPLVNFNGEVIGINSMKLVDSSIEGMGFSIKIEDAMKHIDTLEKGEPIARPLLGITHCNVTDTYTLKRYGISIDSSIKEGIVVISVESGSGADKAGLKKGDVIVKLNDDEVSDMAYLKYLLYQYNAGDTINLTYIRNSKTKVTKVTLTDNSN